MQRRACLFFTEQVGVKTGQVLDRAAAANVTGKRDPPPHGLHRRHWLRPHRPLHRRSAPLPTPHRALLEQVRRTLRFHLGNMPHEHGFLYHFNDVDLGGSFQGSEVSPMDTSLLLCGALTARAHFHSDPEIVDLATRLYERVDWPWMLNGGNTLAMGWRQGKFIPSRWSRYCELMMMVLLAIGSPTHPIPPSAWDAFTPPPHDLRRL